MALRAFKTTFLFAINSEQRFDEDGDGFDEDAPPVTLEEVKEYLDDALRLDIDVEDCGNPVGFCSAEVLIEELVELSEAEVKELYGREK